MRLSEIQRLFAYSPKVPSGLVWAAPGQGRQVGKMAGSRTSRGYYQVFVNGVRTGAHRVVYQLHNPDEDITNIFVDHIDGKPNNNKIDNLRTCNQSQNLLNKKLPSNNKSGTKGVHWNKKDQKWRVVISDGTRRRFVGHFTDLKEAQDAAFNFRLMYHKDFHREL